MTEDVEHPKSRLLALIRNNPELFLALMIARSSLVLLATTAMKLIGLPSIIGVMSVAALLGAVGLLAVRVIWRRLARPAWVFMWLVTCAYLIALLRAPSVGGFHLVVAQDLVIGLMWFAVAVTIHDFKRLRSSLYAAAIVILAAGLIQLSQFAAATDRVSYSQYLAYSLLPAVLILVDAAFARNALVNVGLAGLTFALLLSSGARGPVVAVLLFLALRILMHMRESPTTGNVVAGLVLLAAGFVSSRFETLLSALLSLLEVLGLSTRVVSRLVEGTLLNDHVRESLAQHTIEIIRGNPIFGVGMSNERLLLADAMGRSPEEALGWYPHNFFLEVWAQHGLILGSILIIVLGAGLLSQLTRGLDPDRRAVLSIFVGSGFLPLMFSASYLNWPSFFGLAGICLSGMLRSQDSSRESHISQTRLRSGRNETDKFANKHSARGLRD